MHAILGELLMIAVMNHNNTFEIIVIINRFKVHRLNCIYSKDSFKHQFVFFPHDTARFVLGA